MISTKNPSRFEHECFTIRQIRLEPKFTRNVMEGILQILSEGFKPYNGIIILQNFWAQA